MILGAPVRHLFMQGIVWYLKRKCKVLEIGSYQGASALTWHEAGCDVFCVDAWEQYKDAPALIESAYDEFLRNTEGKGIKHIRGKSSDILPGLAKQSFDIVYIDGDHRYAGVKQDIMDSIPLVKDGGIICGDDLNVQYPDIDVAIARLNAGEDFIRDTNGRKYHPGVTCAVWDVFGKVSHWGGFWAMKKHGRAWHGINLAGMPAQCPAHFTDEDIDDARAHLADIPGFGRRPAYEKVINIPTYE